MIFARLNFRFLRFVINGVFATVVHYTVLATLIEVLHFRSAGLANGIAALFGISASYIGNRIFVFESKAGHGRTLPRFLLVYFLVGLLHAGFLAVWTDYASLPYTLGFLIATVASFLLTYFINKVFIFNSPVVGA